MKRFGMSVCALVSFAALTLPCVAQDNPWNGSWKIDASTIKYDGPTFSVVTDAEGYTVTRAGTPGPKVICNGQPQMDKGEATTCTKAGAGYQLELTKDGRQTGKVTISLSKDGKVMTRKGEFFPADESPYTMTSTAHRVSGGPGVSGEWRQVDVKESQDTGILTIAVDGDSVAFRETDAPTSITCKLDGTETKAFGTTTIAIKQEDPHTLKVTYRSDGKIRRENTFVLSADGKTITETDVTPDPSPSTTSMVFNKS
jgi:hypothetical protein